MEMDMIDDSPWAAAPGVLEAVRGSVAAKPISRRAGQAPRISTQDGAAIIPVLGPIFRREGWLSAALGATTTEWLTATIQGAIADPAVTGIVLEIDSPGGQATGIAELAGLIRSAEKPVVAYVDGLAASGAYWLASAADEIVLSKTGEVGSIGAVFGAYKKSADSEVVEFVSSQSPMKRPDPETDAGRAELQNRIDAIAQVFIEDVAMYRGVPTTTVLEDFGQGGIRLGHEAVALGMADRVGTLDAAMASIPRIHTERSPTMDKQDQPQAVDTTEIIAGLTAETLAVKNPALVNAIAEAAASAERARIQDVMAQSMPGHDALIQALAFDGKTTGPEAAVQVLKAEKAKRANRLEDIKADAPAPVAASVETQAPALTGEDKIKADWDRDEKIRAEFVTYDVYAAFMRAQDSVRISRGAH